LIGLPLALRVHFLELRLLLSLIFKQIPLIFLRIQISLEGEKTISKVFLEHCLNGAELYAVHWLFDFVNHGLKELLLCLLSFPLKGINQHRELVVFRDILLL
jgi:uncharacterized membrane protein YGL010W